jgi:hypothetical protein
MSNGIGAASCLFATTHPFSPTSRLQHDQRKPQAKASYSISVHASPCKYGSKFSQTSCEGWTSRSPRGCVSLGMGWWSRGGLVACLSGGRRLLLLLLLSLPLMLSICFRSVRNSGWRWHIVNRNFGIALGLRLGLFAFSSWGSRFRVLGWFDCYLLCWICWICLVCCCCCCCCYYLCYRCFCFCRYSYCYFYCCCCCWFLRWWVPAKKLPKAIVSQTLCLAMAKHHQAESDFELILRRKSTKRKKRCRPFSS